MFEKLEQFLVDLDLDSEELARASLEINESHDPGRNPDTASAHEVRK